MSIEELMDAANIPYDVQRMTVLDFDRCEGVREYVANVRDEEPVGMNFCLVANACNQNALMTRTEMKNLVWVFAKELILSRRTVKVMNPRNLADQLQSIKPWEEEFVPDFADHLILTNFFRAGQPSPYNSDRLGRLLDYIDDRGQYGKTTHCVWEFRDEERFGDEAIEWFPQLWVDDWFQEQKTKWVERR